LITLKEILKDGYLNGSEKVTKRKVKRELVKLKVWLQLVKNKLKMSLLQVRVQAVNKLPEKLRKKENDYKLSIRLYDYVDNYLILSKVYQKIL
jgi:hypothetical protein